MGKASDFPHIRTNPVIGGVVDYNGFGIFVYLYGLFYIPKGHAQRDSQPVMVSRIDIHRDTAAENQSMDDAAVNIPGQNDFISLLDGRYNHGLYR